MAEEREQQPSELIQHLLLEAGGLMEDASPEFALTWPEDTELQLKRIEILAQLADDLGSLALAAETLHRRNLAE